jgi:hypothetical protein
MVVQLLGFQKFQNFTNKTHNSKQFVLVEFFLGVIDVVRTLELEKNTQPIHFQWSLCWEHPLL